MFIIYPAIFTKEQNGYSVFFPDLKEFTGATCGDDLKDAYYMAIDYLGSTLMDDYLNKKPLPEFSDINDINVYEFFAELYEEDDDKEEIQKAVDNSFVTLVGLDLLQYIKEAKKTVVRKNVSIPSWLNETAKRYNINFSKVLQDALEKELDID